MLLRPLWGGSFSKVFCLARARFDLRKYCCVIKCANKKTKKKKKFRNNYSKVEFFSYVVTRTFTNMLYNFACARLTIGLLGPLIANQIIE